MVKSVAVGLGGGGWELNSKNPSLDDADYDHFIVHKDHFVIEFF